MWRVMIVCGLLSGCMREEARMKLVYPKDAAAPVYPPDVPAIGGHIVYEGRYIYGLCNDGRVMFKRRVEMTPAERNVCDNGVPCGKDGRQTCVLEAP